MTASPRPRMVGVGAAGPCRREAGQATVEAAVLMLLVMMLMLVVVQVGVVVRDKVAVMHLARDAAREASVGTSPGRITAIVRRTLPHARVRVTGGGEVGEPVTVEVTAHVRTSLPLAGHLVPDFTIHERVTMRSER